MSDLSFDRVNAFVPISNFDPGHQLPAQSSGVQPMAQDPAAKAIENHDRTQQLDAGVLQTLNIQAKLAIGAPGDTYEQEADQVASQVVERINTPQSQGIQRESAPEEEMQMKPLAQGIQREEAPEAEEEEMQMKPLAQGIQREEAPEEEQEEMQMKPLAQGIQREEASETEEEEMQMKPLVQRSSDGGGQASEELESSISSQRGQGQPLDKGVRSSMEQAFSADFSGVRVHTGSQSHAMNESVQAKAFTTGQDIFFRNGEYQPESRGGQELLAHELTHVVQQNGSAVQPKEL